MLKHSLSASAQVTAVGLSVLWLMLQELLLRRAFLKRTAHFLASDNTAGMSPQMYEMRLTGMYDP